jgi:SOS-response transcriptional repressor LexA
MLTARQLELYNYIRAQITTTGRAPTLRSMATELGISIPAIVCKLNALQSHGVIRRYHGERRGVALVHAAQDERLAA